MDDDTLYHMVAWIKRALRPEEWEPATSAMIRSVLDDPTICDLGWPRVAKIAGIWEVK
jgi:hypothetical protein